MARKIAVADCETDPFMPGRIPKPFAWGYYDGEQYQEFRSTLEFVEFLKEQPVICYAHNGGKFDWHFILQELEPYDDIMVISGRIAKCNIGLAECRDSYNILPVPLSAYKKDDIDYAIMEEDERDKPENSEKISAYLKSDCVYLYELVSKFIEKYGMQITQASAAMAQWKKISKNVPHTDRDFYAEFSPYYYGGRVQCFEQGIIETDFEVFDINSAYPFAMLSNHPYSKEYTHVEEYLPNADFYKIRCVSRGSLPFRGLGLEHENGFAGLSFPNDNEVREYTITQWEYHAAIETNTIDRVEILESYLFDEHTNFESYIQHFYNLRLAAKKRGDDADSLFAKLLMNSLYGKFAANPDNYRNNMIVPMDVIGGLESQGWEFAGELGPWGLAEAKLEENQQRFYNVATGASITGFVRAMLWRAICTSKGVLYCDTDSISVRQKGESVILGDNLGQWKAEGNFNKAGIAGKKLYIFQGKPGTGTANKTASKGARLIEAEIWQVAAGHEVTYMSMAPTFSIRKSPTFTNRKIRQTA